MIARMTPWREWLAPQRKKLRASSAGTAGFLISVFIAAEVVSRLNGLIFAPLRQHNSVVNWEALEGFSWPWVREHALDLFLTVDNLIGAISFGLVFPIAICVIATAWFFGLSWKDTLIKLGLPKPKRVEFSIPMLASVPAFAFIVLVVWPRTDFTLIDQPVFSGPNIPYLLVAPFGILIPLGLLYRGLIQDAKWSTLRATLATIFLVFLTHVVIFLPLPEMPWSLGILAAGAFYTVIHTGAELWIFRRWGSRLWSLVFLVFGAQLMEACIPLQFKFDHGTTAYGLELTSTWLLLIWTVMNLRTKRTSVSVAASGTNS